MLGIKAGAGLRLRRMALRSWIYCYNALLYVDLVYTPVDAVRAGRWPYEEKGGLCS